MTTEQSTQICFAGGTDRGKVRVHNEDSILCCGFENSDVHLLVVADGVGGHAGGEIASQLAVDILQSEVAKAIDQAGEVGGYDEDWLKRTLLYAIEAANAEILRQQVEMPDYDNMASTVVAILQVGSKLALSHLGDSRAYVFSQNAKSKKPLRQVTEDHTVLQKLLNDKKINKAQFERLPMHNLISQALGLVDDPETYVSLLDWQPDDCYLLCSDGLTNYLSDEQISAILQQSLDVSDTVDMLITHANDYGGGDNISVVLLCQKVPETTDTDNDESGT